MVRHEHGASPGSGPGPGLGARTGVGTRGGAVGPPPGVAPFQVGGGVVGEHFVGRSRELEEIRRAFRIPSRLVVHGPRRQGKTSALREAARRFLGQGGIVVWVDLATVVNLEDVTRRLVAALPMDRLSPDRWASLLPLGVRRHRGLAGGEPLDAFVEARHPSPETVRSELVRVVETIDAVAGHRGWSAAVVLDDVEELLDREDGTGLLRDLVAAGSRLTFLVAGSDSPRLRALTSRGGVLQGKAGLLHVGSIDPGLLGRWIERRLAEAGLLPSEGIGMELVALVGPRTQDVVELAEEVYRHGVPTGRADTEVLQRALGALIARAHNRFCSDWRRLPASQRSVLRALAQGATSLYSEETRRLLSLPAISSTRTAVRGLLAKGILSEEEGERVTFDDPFFRHWTAHRAMPDPLPAPAQGPSRGGSPH